MSFKLFFVLRYDRLLLYCLSALLSSLEALGKGWGMMDCQEKEMEEHQTLQQLYHTCLM